jgi:hypothetical protein
LSEVGLIVNVDDGRAKRFRFVFQISTFSRRDGLTGRNDGARRAGSLR